MKITLIDAGKRFNRDWIFRHLYFEFFPTHSYAITGPNGSGKSTLLQSIAGAVSISEGTIRYDQAAAIASEQAYRLLALCAPYLEVVEK
jgi:ABC-type multidrug transport system ATPase subunit